MIAATHRRPLTAGLTIQRKSHVQEDLLPLPNRRRPIRRPLWLVGFVIYITSNIFSTIFQLDALPIVILAPLGAVSLIFNALLAKVILGDVFGKMAVVGTGLVTLGAILIAVFGVVQEEEHSLDELLRLWRRGPFLAFFCLLVAAVVIILISVSLSTCTTNRAEARLISRHGRPSANSAQVVSSWKEMRRRPRRPSLRQITPHLKRSRQSRSGSPSNGPGGGLRLSQESQQLLHMMRSRGLPPNLPSASLRSRRQTTSPSTSRRPTRLSPCRLLDSSALSHWPA